MYPNDPAIGVTEASHSAARLIRRCHTVWQITVYNCIKRLGGATWKDVALELCENSRNVQPSFSELKELGLIVGTGRRSGRCEIYRVVSEGEGVSHAGVTNEGT